MLYGDAKTLIQALNTGATNPDSINLICKLVLGKMARRKLRDRVKLAEITTSGLTTLNLKTLLPDYFDLKITIDNNKPKSVYYYQGDIPIYLDLVNFTEFNEYISGGYVSVNGREINISVPFGQEVPSKIYFPYYSFYMVLDKDGSTEKETPVDNDDLLLFPSVFDDVFIDGVLLYLSRREKQDAEYTKNVQEWEKRLNDLSFYN